MWYKRLLEWALPWLWWFFAWLIILLVGEGEEGRQVVNEGRISFLLLIMPLVIGNFFILNRFPNFLRLWEYTLLAFSAITYEFFGILGLLYSAVIYVANFFLAKDVNTRYAGIGHIVLMVSSPILIAIVVYYEIGWQISFAFCFFMFALYALVRPKIALAYLDEDKQSGYIGSVEDSLWIFYLFASTGLFLILSGTGYSFYIFLGAFGMFALAHIHLRTRVMLKHFLLGLVVSFLFALNCDFFSIEPCHWPRVLSRLTFLLYWASFGALFMYGARFCMPLLYDRVEHIGLPDYPAPFSWQFYAMRFFLSLLFLCSLLVPLGVLRLAMLVGASSAIGDL